MTGGRIRTRPAPMMPAAFEHGGFRFMVIEHDLWALESGAAAVDRIKVTRSATSTSARNGYPRELVWAKGVKDKSMNELRDTAGFWIEWRQTPGYSEFPEVGISDVQRKLEDPGSVPARTPQPAAPPKPSDEESTPITITKDDMPYLPDNDAWLDRFKALRSFYDTRGRLPRSNNNGGPEDTMRTWLERQRAAWEAGLLPENLEGILRIIPKSLPARRRPPEALKRQTFKDDPAGRIQAFYAEHGRLPQSRGPEAGERFLYKYLLETARPRFSAGTLNPDIAQRLSTVPGALMGRKYNRRKAS